MVPWRGSLIKWLPWCPLTVLHHCHRRHYLSVWILDSRQVPRLTLRSLPWRWFGNLTNIPPRSCYHLFWGEGGMTPSCGSIAPCFFWAGVMELGFLRDGVMVFWRRCDVLEGWWFFERWCEVFWGALRWVLINKLIAVLRVSPWGFFIGSVSGFRLDKYFSMVQKGSNDSNHKPSISCSMRLVPKEPSRLSVFAFKILSSYLLTSSEAVWGF